jgi:hypothetical protein
MDGWMDGEEEISGMEVDVNWVGRLELKVTWGERERGWRKRRRKKMKKKKKTPEEQYGLVRIVSSVITSTSSTVGRFMSWSWIGLWSLSPLLENMSWSRSHRKGGRVTMSCTKSNFIWWWSDEWVSGDWVSEWVCPRSAMKKQGGLGCERGSHARKREEGKGRERKREGEEEEEEREESFFFLCVIACMQVGRWRWEMEGDGNGGDGNGNGNGNGELECDRLREAGERHGEAWRGAGGKARHEFGVN